MNNDRLEIRLPSELLKSSQDTAKALNMHHAQFVRQAIEEKIKGSKRRLKVMEIVKPQIDKGMWRKNKYNGINEEIFK